MSPRYVGHYRILKRMGKVAYELEFPLEMASVHPIFYMLMLRKCVGSPEAILPLNDVRIEPNLAYEEVPIEILDRKVKKLRNKELVSVKVLW